jgi:hypothetical protein
VSVNSTQEFTLGEVFVTNLFSENFKSIEKKDVILSLSSYICLKAKKLGEMEAVDALLAKE